MLSISRSHNRTLRIEFPAPGLPAGVFRARKYGDPFMVRWMSLDTYVLGTSNFQNVDLWTPTNGFKSVGTWQSLGPAQLDYLKAIQPQDAGSFASKMAFLVGERIATPDRPYWTEGGAWNGAWTSFKFGTLVFGGQLVKVKTDAAGNPILSTFTGQYQTNDNTPHPIEFYELDGMPWAARNNVSHATHPWWIQKCTWASYDANSPTRCNIYRDTWNSGVVFHPVWKPEEFPSNHGGRLYIAKAFLEAA